MTRAVAAAASEPSSLTSMKAFWMTADTTNFSLAVIPENGFGTKTSN